MTTALIITTFNRPQYLKQCFESIKALKEKPDIIIIVDDASKDNHTKELITSFIPKCRYAKSFRQENKGIKQSLLEGFYDAFTYYNCDIAINLDSDAIVKPDFITRLKDLKQRFPDHIISGFNCNNPKNPIITDGNDYVERKHCNGINMVIDKHQYENIIRPALQSNGNWDFASTHNKNFIITKPSVCDHLGANDSTMGHVGGDVACDF